MGRINTHLSASFLSSPNFLRATSSSKLTLKSWILVVS